MMRPCTRAMSQAVLDLNFPLFLGQSLDTATMHAIYLNIIAVPQDQSKNGPITFASMVGV